MFYQLNVGLVWGVEEANFVAEVPADSVVIPLCKDGDICDKDYLKETFKFYGHKIGDELLTDEDRAREAREKRDQLLAETDYLLMPDYPIEAAVLAALKTYRQALRDVPEQTGFPNTIEWPSKPEVIL